MLIKENILVKVEQLSKKAYGDPSKGDKGYVPTVLQGMSNDVEHVRWSRCLNLQNLLEHVKFVPSTHSSTDAAGWGKLNQNRFTMPDPATDELKVAQLVEATEEGPTLQDQIKQMEGEGRSDHASRLYRMLLCGCGNHIYSKDKYLGSQARIVFKTKFPQLADKEWRSYLNNLYAMCGHHPTLMTHGLKYEEYCHLSFSAIDVLCSKINGLNKLKSSEANKKK
jgi:hypothetical protein